MKILKDIVKSAVFSIMVSMCIFVIVGMVFDLIGKGTFQLEDYRFTKMVAACVIAGLGFGVPTVFYSIEKLSKAVASVLHLGVGFTVYFIVAAIVGWIPTSVSLIASLVTIVGALLIGGIIWFCFMRYYRNLADQMNRAIERRQ